MLLKKLKYNFNHYKNNIAFCIDDVNYTYHDLEKKIIAIQQKLINNQVKSGDVIIVKTYNDIETYASILAIWFTGAIFVPVNPTHPKERNELILDQIEAKFTLSSNTEDIGIKTKGLQNLNQNINIVKREENDTLYILFTSGSTGVPKGVPLSLKNISSFLADFNKNFNLFPTDKFLQIYDLTADTSVHCYLLPLYIGASVYTVTTKKIKYLEAYKLMEKYQITFAKFPPSIITYLKPFFKKIDLPHLRYSLFGGEILNIEIVTLWQKCVPNARVYNVYGPTEATINTHLFPVFENLKTYNDIVSIGKPFGKNKALIIDENNTILPINKKGELCLYGDQITKGYLDHFSNQKSFTYINNKRIYKTGDLAYIDKNGYYMFCGRIDNQVKIQGYRVELSEIENVAKQFGHSLNFAVVSAKNKMNVLEVILFTEKLETTIDDLYEFLKLRLPNYMIPSKIINLTTFFMTASGKIDKQMLISKHLK